MKAVSFWFFVRRGMFLYAIIFIFQEFLRKHIWWNAPNPGATKGCNVIVHFHTKKMQRLVVLLDFNMDVGEIPWLEKFFKWCYIEPEY